MISAYLDGVQFTDFTSFDKNASLEGILGGEIASLGEAWQVDVDDESPLAESDIGAELTPGHGVLFFYRHREGSEFTFQLAHTRNEPSQRGALQLSFRRGRLVFRGDETGASFSEGLIGNLSTVPGQWYGVLPAVDPSGRGFALIWDAEDPARRAFSRFVFSEPGHNWNLRIHVTRSTVSLNGFAEFSFDAAK